jgi:hypothetical protein
MMDRGERESEAVFHALVFGGEEILRAVERRPCEVGEIVARTGIAVEDVEEALELMKRRGLLEEVNGRFRATDSGKYMNLVVGMIDHDLRAIKRGEGLKATAHHAFLAEHLRERRVDVEDMVKRMWQGAELMKRNMNALIEILSYPLDNRTRRQP